VYAICCLKEENERIISQAEEEYNVLMEYIDKDVQRNRKGNMYNNVNFIVDILHPYCMDNLKEGCSKNVINMGYDLTDILEHIGEFDRAVELAETISDLIKVKEKVKVEEAQKFIGCAYTFAIARPENILDRERLLREAEKLFSFCKSILDSHKTKWSRSDWLFLNGLFHSDYAAYLLNRGQMAEERSEKGYEKYYEEALKEHEKSLEDRENYLRCQSNSENEKKDSAERRIIQSKSNIAYCKEYLRQYDKAIEEYENVIKMWDGKNEITRSYLTKRYIVRTYLKKAKEGALTEKQKEHCLEYIRECLEYYDEEIDRRSYEQVMEMKQELTNYQF
jgi:tetratricopeptide (TPR) repeat protein